MYINCAAIIEVCIDEELEESRPEVHGEETKAAGYDERFSIGLLHSSFACLFNISLLSIQTPSNFTTSISSMTSWSMRITELVESFPLISMKLVFDQLIRSLLW
jgi:hypothetical protein